MRCGGDSNAGCFGFEARCLTQPEQVVALTLQPGQHLFDASQPLFLIVTVNGQYEESSRSGMNTSVTC